MNLLAETFSNAQAEWLITAIVVIAALAVLVRNILGAWTDGRKLWGRKPPIDDDLNELREELKELAPAEQVNKLIDHLATAATKDDVQRIRDELKGYVDQDQMDRRMAEVKEQIARSEKDLTQQIKDLRGYLHDDVHEFRKSAQATWANAELQREGLHSRINVMSEVLSEIRGWMRAKFNGGSAS
jgi:hypothetical protein